MLNAAWNTGRCGMRVAAPRLHLHFRFGFFFFFSYLCSC